MKKHKITNITHLKYASQPPMHVAYVTQDGSNELKYFIAKNNSKFSLKTLSQQMLLVSVGLDCMYTVNHKKVAEHL